MEIIAKTSDGYLIKAKTKEVQEILKAVNGNLPDNLDIGQKLPAIDYAATITKVKTMKDDYDFKAIFNTLGEFYEKANELKRVVEHAGTIEEG